MFTKRNITKAFTSFFFIIIILSFVLWGVGDIIRNINIKNIADISGLRGIKYEEFHTQMDFELKKFKNLTNQDISHEKAIELGIADYVIRKIVEERILQDQAVQNDLIIGDKEAIKAIKHDKSFFSEDNKFSTEKFYHILSNNHITENEYIAKIKEALLRYNLLSTIANSANFMNDFEDILARHYAQNRTVEEYIIDADKLETTAIPQEAIENYYNEHQDKFMNEEMRDIEYVLFDKSVENADQFIDDIENEIAISDDVIHIANKYRGKVKSLVKQTRTNMIDHTDNIVKNSQFSEVAFQIDENHLSSVLEIDKSLIVLKIKKIYAPSPKGLEEVASIIRNELEQAQKNSAISAFVTKIKQDFENVKNVSYLTARERNVNYKSGDSLSETAFSLIKSEFSPIHKLKENQYAIYKLVKIKGGKIDKEARQLAKEQIIKSKDLVIDEFIRYAMQKYDVKYHNSSYLIN